MGTFEGKSEPIMWLSRDMCRICLRNSSTSSVNVSVVAEKYREITDFVIQPTDVPQRLCLECHNLIQEFFEFVQTCKRTEETLRTLQRTELNSTKTPLGASIETCFVAGAEIKEEFVECKPEFVSECKVEDREDPGPKLEDLEAQEVSSRKVSKTKRPKEKSFECEECGKKFAYRFVLRRHIETHKTNPAKSPIEASKYMCSKCGKSFKRTRSLRNHEMKTHDKTGGATSVCEICGKTMYVEYIKQHRKTMHGDQPYKEPRIPCETCGKLIAKHNMSVHRRTHIPVPLYARFLCDMCPKRSFKFKHDLARHMVESHISSKKRKNSLIQKMYTCSYCEKAFTAKIYRRAHELAKHEGAEKKCQCIYEGCTKMFYMEHQMKNHLQIVHSKGESFLCSTCGKGFKSKIYLKHHQYSHNRNYSCPYKNCQRTYTAANVLRDHMSKVHPEFKMPPKGTKLQNVDLSIYFQADSK